MANATCNSESITCDTDNPPSFLPAIRAALREKETPISSILRLVACEMALVILEMSQAQEHPSSWKELKLLKTRLSGLCQLRSVLLSTAKLVRKSDQLDFDSAQFQFVFEQVCLIYKKSVTQAGYSEFDLGNIMRHFSMNLSMQEQQIRRDTAKIGTA